MNKRIKQERIDRLNELPDHLLIHILGFLETKDAAKTCLLSKRWRFLWTELPRLVFRDRVRRRWKRSDERKFVARVHRAVYICRKTNLERFEVDFPYIESFARDVNAWVEFAVKNKVKEVFLRLNTYGDLYRLPHMMYSNSSWTSLLLQGCIMSPPRRSIQWQSLTSLFLNKVELPQRAIDEILSGCPVLHSLTLRYCCKYNCFEVNSQSLCELTIVEAETFNEPSLKISAPYLRRLAISVCSAKRKLHLRNISSVVSADINFTDFDWGSSSEQVTSNAMELLEKTKHAKKLMLRLGFVEVVSTLVLKGWRPPQSTRRWLTTIVRFAGNRGTCGIIGLLGSSPNIETLVIDIFHMFCGSEEPIVARDDDLDCELLHLKRVEIRYYAEPNLGSDQILRLARILLKRATVLEEMVIVNDLEDKSEFVKISQTLHTYPRSSQKSILILR